MAGEMPYYNWGQSLPAATYGPDLAESVLINVPRAPGCMHWNPTAVTSRHMCKYRVRTHYYCETDAVLHTTFQLKGAAEFDDDTLALEASPGDWDETSVDANAQNAFPDAGEDFSELWNRYQVLPCSLMKISWWCPYEHAAITGRINGVEVAVRYDEDNDAEDMPVWDWYEAAISDQYLPASSVLMMKALAETYDRILYASTWAIQAAVPGDSDRSPA
jgi:hypothetical protein